MTYAYIDTTHIVCVYTMSPRSHTWFTRTSTTPGGMSYFGHRLILLRPTPHWRPPLTFLSLGILLRMPEGVCTVYALLMSPHWPCQWLISYPQVSLTLVQVHIRMPGDMNILVHFIFVVSSVIYSTYHHLAKGTFQSPNNNLQGIPLYIHLIWTIS